MIYVYINIFLFNFELYLFIYVIIVFFLRFSLRFLANLIHPMLNCWSLPAVNHQLFSLHFLSLHVPDQKNKASVSLVYSHFTFTFQKKSKSRLKKNHPSLSLSSRSRLKKSPFTSRFLSLQSDLSFQIKKKWSSRSVCVVSDPLS